MQIEFGNPPGDTAVTTRDTTADEYQRLDREKRLPVARGYRFVGNDRLRGELIERLMCDHRVDVAGVCRGVGGDPAALLGSPLLGTLITDGLVETDGACIAVKPHARPLVRSVAAAFDAHLSNGGGHHSRAV